jgi:hypothetical protein
VVTMDGIEAI